MRWLTRSVSPASASTGQPGAGCWRSVVVKLTLVDDVDVEAEGPGDLVEEPSVGEEPLSSGALADGTAVVGGIQEAMEGCLGEGRRGSAVPVDPQQDGLFGKRGRPKRDDAGYADHVAYGLFEELFRTGCEPDASVEFGVSEDDEDWLNPDDFTGTDARMLTEWQRELCLEGTTPSILHAEGTAIGIGWGDKVALRFTTVDD